MLFGAYDPEYPRNTVIKRGLRLNGVTGKENLFIVLFFGALFGDSSSEEIPLVLV